MTLSEKLRALQAKNKFDQFVLVESVKDGQVIVSGVFDRSMWTMLRIEQFVTRRTLALVDSPFNIRIMDILPNSAMTVVPPSPHIEH